MFLSRARTLALAVRRGLLPTIGRRSRRLIELLLTGKLAIVHVLPFVGLGGVLLYAWQSPSLLKTELDGQLTEAKITLEQRASWEIKIGHARAVYVFGLNAAEVDLRIPFPSRYCTAVADAVGGACNASTALIKTPLVATWMKPQQLQGWARGGATRVVLTTDGQREAGGALGLGISTKGGKRPTLCFYSARSSNSLTFGTDSAGPSWRPPVGLINPCAKGLLLRISGRNAGGLAAIYLDGIDGLQLTASGEKAIVSTGLDGNVRLRGEERHVGLRDRLTLKAADGLEIDLLIGGAAASLDLGTKVLDSAEINDEKHTSTSKLQQDTPAWLGVAGFVFAVLEGCSRLIEKLRKRGGEQS